MHTETHEVITLAASLIITSVILVMAAFLMGTAREMAEADRESEAVRSEIRDEADRFFMENPDGVLGTDVIGFIMDKNIRADYWFTFLVPSKNGGITLDLAYDRMRAGSDVSVLYGVDFLTNSVLTDSVSSTFRVTHEKNGERDVYRFEEMP